ncbi:MAG: CDP-glucose 4,6-dehydratase [bacterium]|nr:CDP-glucose 4,6-dehydratase [bacterium]
MKNLQSFYKNKKVLITGHSGFKGSWLSQILLFWGAKVAGVSLRPATSPALFNLLKIRPRVNNYFADVRNLKKIKEIFSREKPEIIFHLAAQPIVRESYDNPALTFETNIMGTANVLEAIRFAKSVRSAVMITTDKVYENKETDVPYKEEDKLGGHDPYSSSKASAEIVINSYVKSFFNPKNYNKSHKTLIASARAGNVIGGGDWSKDRIMTDVVRAIFETKSAVIVRSPEAIRPWQFVLEPLYGYLALAKNLYNGRRELSGALNLGPQEAGHLKVKDILQRTFRHLGAGSYILERNLSKHEATLLKLDSSKALNYLKWRSAIDANEALKLTLDWYKNYYENGDVSSLTDKQIKDFFK